MSHMSVYPLRIKYGSIVRLYHTDTFNEACHEKTSLYICENNYAAQLRSNQRLFFATWIVQSLYFQLKTNSSHLLWLYSSVCVGPGRKS